MDTKVFIRNLAFGSIIGLAVLFSRGCSYNLNKEKPTKEELKNDSITFETISEEELDKRINDYFNQDNSQENNSNNITR